MRNAFINTLTELAEKDERILLLTADLGYTVLEPFAEKFPDRFINVGVAEQNMVGVASGLAASGFIPFVYSIVNFASMRPYEFIRNGPVAHQLPVRIIGIGSGYDYGPAGMTHYGLEDVGLMRMQSDLTVIVPADQKQAENSLKKTYDYPRPVYYRIGKGNKEPLAGFDGQFDLGKINVFKEGSDMAFVSVGGITKEVLAASELLKSKGISSSILVVSSFNPSSDQDLVKHLKKFQLALTVEDHYITGGIGSYVCEVVAGYNIECSVLRCGVKTLLNDRVGSKTFMNHQHGLSSKKLADAAFQALKNKKNGKPVNQYSPTNI